MASRYKGRRPRTGQANLGNGSAAAVKATLTRMKKRRVKILALCEAGDRVDTILEWCHENGWSAFFGTNVPGAASTPIIWDDSLTVTHLGTRKSTDATDCGAIGVGPNVVKAKVLNHVRVSGEGFEAFVFVSFHLPASLYNRKRRRLAKKIVADMLDMFRRRDGLGEPDEKEIDIVYQGDANCTWRSLVMRPLRKAGLKQSTKSPTHGLFRTIDLSISSAGGHAEVIRILSDHKGVVLNPN